MTVNEIYDNRAHDLSLCRVCGRSLYKEPLLVYKNMPRSAQFLPTGKELDDDKGVTLRICQCSGCGLVQLSANPVHYYRQVIRAAAVSLEMRQFRLKQFADFLTDHGLAGKKIIEIGCGHGEYLELMRDCGADAFGVEFSSQAVTDCQKKNLKVSKGFVDQEDYHLENGPFSAFFMLNFLEHLPDPGATLCGISRNLQDNAAGLIEVPNFDMMLDKKLFSEFVTDHLFYFTRASLITTLSMCGFDVLDCHTVWYDYILSAQVRKRKKTNLDSFILQQERLQAEIDSFLGLYTPETVAVWGAGHQAFAVLAMSGMAGRVKFVVDSSPFKQGRYTPATHIEIVSPKALSSTDIQAVIVMAASYSDEVASIIHKEFNSGLKIAILRDHGLEIL